MNLEVKKMQEKEHSQMMQFGWALKDVIKENRGGHIRLTYIMTRDKDREHYDELVKLEQKYRTYKNSLKPYKPMDEGVTIILYLLFILPGVIYTIYKSKEKDEISAWNESLVAKMNKVVKEAEQYL